MKFRSPVLLTVLLLALFLTPGCGISAPDGLDCRAYEAGDEIDAGSFSGDSWKRCYLLDRSISTLRLDLRNRGDDSIFLYLSYGEPLELLPGQERSISVDLSGSLQWKIRPRINGQKIDFSWSAVLTGPDGT